VCLSILDEEKDWKASLNIKQVLIGIQDLLSNPNPRDPAQAEAYQDYISNREQYNAKCKKQAQKFRA